MILLKDKVFKVKFNIKTCLKIFKNRDHDKQAHINETIEQWMWKLTSDRKHPMFMLSIGSDGLQWKCYHIITKVLLCKGENLFL